MLKKFASTPLQQSLKYLDKPDISFFESCTGKGKYIRVESPKFKSINYRQSAIFVGGNYRVGKDKLFLTKRK